MKSVIGFIKLLLTIVGGLLFTIMVLLHRVKNLIQKFVLSMELVFMKSFVSFCISYIGEIDELKNYHKVITLIEEQRASLW